MDSGHADGEEPAIDVAAQEGEAAPAGATAPTTPDDLRETAARYARVVVDRYDVAIDLDALEWAVDETDRRKRLAARTVYRSLPGARVGDPVDWRATDHDRTCRVELTWNAYEALGWRAYAATIRHELVHVEQVHRFGTTGHDRRFYDRADDLDTTRHCEPWTEPRYRLRCPECETELRRYRESKWVRLARAGDAYCGTCETPLRLETNPQ